jgi:hypothetical protein
MPSEFAMNIVGVVTESSTGAAKRVDIELQEVRDVLHELVSQAQTEHVVSERVEELCARLRVDSAR